MINAKQNLSVAKCFVMRHRRTLIETALLSAFFLVVFNWLVAVQGFERFYSYTRQYEHIQLDHIFLAVAPGCVVLAIVAALRVRDSRRAELRLRLLASDLDAALKRENLLRAAADEANRAKSAFLANMSHELRTPLNAVIGYTEMVVEDIEGVGGQAEEDLGKVLNAAQHLLALINDILDLAKIEAGRVECSPTSFNAAMAIQDVLSLAGPLATRSNTTLIGRGMDSLGFIQSDHRMFKQCVLNLVSNACKFAPDGVVEVDAARSGDVLEVIVKDTGIGMTPEALSQLFQPFHQADSTITKRFGGTGLGLAITRNLASLLGGDVQLDSVAGEGTTARLSISTVLEAKDTDMETALAA